MTWAALKDFFSPDIFAKHPSYSLWRPQASPQVYFFPWLPFCFPEAITDFRPPCLHRFPTFQPWGAPCSHPPSSDTQASEAVLSSGSISRKGLLGSYPSLFHTHQATFIHAGNQLEGARKVSILPWPPPPAPTTPRSLTKAIMPRKYPFIHFPKAGLRYNLHTMQRTRFMSLIIKLNDFSVPLKEVQPLQTIQFETSSSPQ